MFKKLLKSLPLGVMAISAASGVASAQQASSGIGDIVVTAQKREQKLQDVPVAVSALDSNMLEANGITQARDLDAFVPNLSVRNIVGGSRIPSYSLRGINVIGSSPGADRGVATYIDGVYLSASSANFELADMERVEVLRGPQGTLFGRNSNGGAVAWYTKDPDGKLGIKQDFTIGNYDQLSYKTRLSTPQWGPFSASVTYAHSERQGDIKNLGAGTTWDMRTIGRGFKKSPEYMGDDDSDGLAAAIKFEPTDYLKFVYKYDQYESDYTQNGIGVLWAQPSILGIVAAQPNPALMTPVSLERPKAVNNANSIPMHYEAWGHNLTSTWNISDAFTLKSITAWRKTAYEAEWSNIDGFGGLVIPSARSAVYDGFLGGPRALGIASSTAGALGVPLFGTNLQGTPSLEGLAGTPYVIQGTATSGWEEQKSQEIQLNYDTDAMTLTMGAIYFENEISRGKAGNPVNPGQANSKANGIYPGFVLPSASPLSSMLNSGGGRPTSIKVVSAAVYGQAEFHITPDLDLVLGGRYTKDHKEGTDNILVNAANPTVPGPRQVRYQLSRPTYNLGINYKVTPSILTYGKFSTGFISGGVVSSVPFREETSEAFEAGIKADWFNRRLRTNLAVFNAEYANAQLASSGRNINADSPGCGQTATGIPGGFCSSLSQVIVNPGDARAKGFELETTWLPLDVLTLTANVGYTDFKFTRINKGVFGTRCTAANAPVGPCPSVGFFLEDDVLPVQRPDWTLSFAADYESHPIWQDVTLKARLDANYRSDIFMSTIPTFSTTNAATNAALQKSFREVSRIEGYWIANTRVGLNNIKVAGGDLQLAFWVRNLFDEGSVSYAPNLVTVLPADYERARTIGMDLSVKF